MLITNHVLSGAVVGLIAPGPGTAATGGFASHFLLDAVPHFGVDEEHLMRIAVPDGLLGLACIGAVLAATPGRQRLPVAAGIAGACLPDMDKPGRQFFDRSPFPAWFDRVHDRIQREAVHRWTVELTAAAGLVVTLVLLLRGR